ncbi:hypothetical protein KRR39_02235 [Nocardioides panacis]|uniref:Uncharacterized protein n=1 Tax=Nocardioides panacis TaxID=2849501 RepID=A0A975SZ95_9ACTN|nr:hypothetical protein [Nocardioides panacis]QWZ08699.1 hypothetical protein KRR39_02235 [Nocardioides panacis]
MPRRGQPPPAGGPRGPGLGARPAALRPLRKRRALANLGTTRELAEEYLEAGVLFLTSLLSDAAQAFADGLLAASPHATGAFTWSGVALLQSDVEYTVHDGRVDLVGGALTPLAYLFLAVGAVAVGRLWRVLPGWRRTEVDDVQHRGHHVD